MESLQQVSENTFIKKSAIHSVYDSDIWTVLILFKEYIAGAKKYKLGDGGEALVDNSPGVVNGDYYGLYVDKEYITEPNCCKYGCRTMCRLTK